MTIKFRNTRQVMPVVPPPRGITLPQYRAAQQAIDLLTPTTYYPELPAPLAEVWGNPGVPGGIPAYSDGVSVMAYGAVGNGTTDDTTAFVNAIAAAAAGTAVIIPAGTYRITSTITINKAIALRGVGSASRIKFNFASYGDAGFKFANSSHGSYINITANIAAGAKSLTVADASGFAVGDYIELKMDNESFMYTDAEWNQAWAAGARGQTNKITAINGSVLTVADPILLDYPTTLNPQVRELSTVKNAGVENLYLESTGVNTGVNIFFVGGVECWVKNIESAYCYEKHIWLSRAYRCTVRDSYIHHSHDYGEGGRGYGVVTENHASYCLIENNAFTSLRHAMMPKVGGVANVWGYNASTDSKQTEPNVIPYSADISLHGHYPAYNLFEGNHVVWIANADYWGPSGPGNTFFRNQVDIDASIIYSPLTNGSIVHHDASHNQYTIGNNCVDGNVKASSGVYGTLIYGNRQTGDTPTQTTLDTLPDSYYLTAAPDWYGTLSFPSIGADFATGEIPAMTYLLTGIGFGSDATVGTGTLSAGITGSGFASDSDAGTGTLTVNIIGIGFGSDADAGTGTLAVNVTGIGFSSDGDVGTGTIAAGIVGVGFGSDGDVGTGTLAVEISGAGFASDSDAGTGTIAVNITGIGFGSDSDAGTGELSTSGLLTGVGFGSDSDAGTGTIADEIIGIGFNSGADAGTGTLSVSDVLQGIGFDSGSAAGTGVISVEIAGIGFSSDSDAGIGELSTAGVLTGVGFGSDATVGTGTLSAGITGSGFASDSDAGAGTLSGVITGVGFASDSAVGTGTLAVEIAGIGFASDSDAGTGELSIGGVLQGAGFGSDSDVGTGTLTVNITGVGFASDSDSGTGALAINIIGIGFGSDSDVGTGTLEIGHVLLGIGFASDSDAGTGTITSAFPVVEFATLTGQLTELDGLTGQLTELDTLMGELR